MKIRTIPPKILSQNLTATGLTLYLNNIDDFDGNDLTSSQFSTYTYAMLRNSNRTQVELIELDASTIATTPITITKRGLGYDGTIVASTETAYDWLANETIVELGSDVPQIFEQLVDKDRAQTITGEKTFTTVPKSTAAPTAGTDVANKDYVDSVGSGGVLSYNRIVEAGTAGETITIGQLVYLKVADDRWWKCDADTAATVDNIILGIAQGAGSAGAAITNGVLTEGVDSNQSGLTPDTLYYASNTAGGISTSAGTTVVKVGIAISATQLRFHPRFDTVLTTTEKSSVPSAGEKLALAGGSTFGTPSATNKFITQDYNASATGLPVVRVYGALNLGDATTQFDITNPSGTTFRYTYDGTGTDPGISATTVPTGAKVLIQSTGIQIADLGKFTVTGSGANYFEVTNAGGAAESNKVLGTGGYLQVTRPYTWTKPAGLKYVVVEAVGGGGAGGFTTSNTNSGAGGGAGEYVKSIIAAASLGATETATPGAGGYGDKDAGSTGGAGEDSTFGALLTAKGGAGGASEATPTPGGAGGSGGTGDFKLNGEDGSPATPGAAGESIGGRGGSSQLGKGGAANNIATSNTSAGPGKLYGGGGAGGTGTAAAIDVWGGNGAGGAVIVTEYYS